MKPYYDDGTCTIYHGDARDVLPELSGPVDLVLTDPPYGQQVTSNRSGPGAILHHPNVRADGARQGMRVARQALFEAMPLLAPDAHALVFCHWESWPDFYDAVSALMPIKNALIWHKDRGGMGDTDMEYARDYEVVLYAASGRRAIAGKRSGAVLRGFPPVGVDRLHPVEKPTGLLRHLIGRHCPPGCLVLDPFLGAGSTLRAAKDTGRRAIGIEIEERYCEIAARRLAQEVLAF